MSSQQELSDDEILAYARMPEWYFAVICAEGEAFRVVVLDLPELEATGRNVADAMELANRMLMERADKTIRAGGAFPAPSHPDDLKAQHPDYFVHPWQGAFLPSPGGLRPVQISEEEFRIKHGNFIANSLRKKMRAITQEDAPSLAPIPRSNPLTSVINQAHSSALDPEDPHSVWAALVRMAESPNRPAPLIGYAEDEGIKYQDEKGVQFLTRKNFRDRERRARTRASAR